MEANEVMQSGKENSDKEDSYEIRNVLEKKLKEKSESDLYAKYRELWKKREVGGNGVYGFPSHGLDHVEMVAKNICDLIKGVVLESLTKYELYILLCAIYLHDVSMNIGVRYEHAKESANLVEKEYADIIKDSKLRSAICDVIESHGEYNFENFVRTKYPYGNGELEHVSGEKIRVGLLMSLLRLGDLMDWCEDRAPEMIMKEIPILGSNFPYWFLHRLIKGITPHAEKKYIEVDCQPKGPYSANLLKQTLNWFNRELDSNRTFLAEAGLHYQNYRFSTPSSNAVEKKLHVEKVKGNDKLFRPFESYDENEYLKLFGRDEDAEKIAHLILEAHASKKVFILFGDSGVGKTSMIKSMIMQIFNEYDFNCFYRSDYDNFSLDSIRNEITISSKGENKSEKKLLILDQLERAFCLDDIVNIIKCLSEDEGNPHILLTITTNEYGELAKKVDEYGLHHSGHSLREVNILFVVEHILKLGGIKFDDELVEEIINVLLSEGGTIKNSIDKAHIVFKGIISRDKRMLFDKDQILSPFDNTKNMCNQLLKEFFEEKFSSLSDLEKKILQKACREQGSGTKRTSIRENSDIIEIKELVSKKIIHYYDKEKKYEFLHDLLAHYYYKNILTEEEKKIKHLLDRIQSSNTVDVETLEQVLELKEVIQSELIEDSVFFNLSYSYIKTDKTKYEEEILYWICKIRNPRNLVQYIMAKLTGSSNIADRYEQLSCFNNSIEYYLKHNESDDILQVLREYSNQSDDYIERNVARIILKHLGKEDTITSSDIIVDGDYNQICINERCADLLEELYYYCSEHSILDSILKKGIINQSHLVEINILFKAYIRGLNFHLYVAAYKNTFKREMVESNIKISLLKKIMSASMESIDGTFFLDGRLTIRKNGEVYFNHDTLRKKISGFNSQEEGMEWAKFSLNEEIKLFAYKTEKESESFTPMFALKKRDFYSEFLSENDVKKNIWRCKANIFNNKPCEYTETMFEALYVKIKNYDEDVMKCYTIENFVKENKEDIIKLFSLNNYCESDNKLNNFQIKYLYGILQLIDRLSSCSDCSGFLNESIDIYLKCKDVYKSATAKEYNLFDSFYLKLSNDKVIDPIGIKGMKDNHVKVLEYRFPKTEPAIKVHDVSKLCRDEIQFKNNSLPILAIYIGGKIKSVIDLFGDSFSFSVGWEDRISKVSKAIDAWEYELTKIFFVLKSNPFIRHILIVGPSRECVKATNFLVDITNKKGERDKPTADSCNQLGIFCPYDDYQDIFSKIELEIINTDEITDDNLIIEEISNYFSNIYSDIQASSIEGKVISDCINRKDDLNESAKKYLIKHGVDKNSIYNIRVNDINVAHKCMIAALLCYGNTHKDSQGKEVYELSGVGITLENINNAETKIEMLFRRNEIDEYYKSQWKGKGGEVQKYIETYIMFEVKQKAAMMEVLVSAIKKKLATRKIAFTFYSPQTLKKDINTIPSLFSCFLMPQFRENLCILDVFFVWRSNECVFGLPLSLESCIRWINEVILPEVREETKENIEIGNYTYYGINMHCYSNEIMATMIKKILSD